MIGAGGDDVRVMGEQAVPAPRAFERERDLAAALQALDPAAWRQLFEEQYERVYRYAYLRLGNAAEADDIAAAVFVEAVKGIRGFRFRGAPVAAWLLRIAHNETVDALKRRTRRATTSLEHPAAAEALQARDELGVSDEWRDLAAAMGKLRQSHREVLTLRLVEGRSVEETARLLGKKPGAVKVLQMRALKALQSKMGS